MTARPIALLLGLAAALCTAAAAAQERSITVASTTSTEASGLFDWLLPPFERETGIAVRVVAKGTGQAIQLARRGDADVLFVHHPPSEKRFVAEGYGVRRYKVMYNDFVIVGPASDHAGIRGMTKASAAMAKIAAARAPFASRGDDSGTHKAERALWRAAGIAPRGGWYRETGSGMGATLNIAAAMGAYALTDRGTWIAFANKRGLRILVEGDPSLFNQYGVILVDPKRFAHVNAVDGRRFIDWLVSEEGQRRIAAYRVGGQQLFFPDAE